MSLFALLMAVLIGLIFSVWAEDLPRLLLGWIIFPRWLLWLSLLALVSWCMNDAPPNS